MDSLVHTLFSSHLQYHTWAMAELWDSLRPLESAKLHQPLGTSFDTLYSTITHMHKVDVLWISRLNGSPANLSDLISPESPVQLESTWLSALRSAARDTAALDESRLRDNCAFVNSQGVRFQMPVWQVLLQLVNHGTAHRGQVNGMLRQLGTAPKNTDLVQFYRANDFT